jgi:hypothetical protein
MESPAVLAAQQYSERLRAFLDCYGAFREIRELTYPDDATEQHSRAWADRQNTLQLLATSVLTLRNSYASEELLCADLCDRLDRLRDQFGYDGAQDARRREIPGLDSLFARLSGRLHRQGDRFPGTRDDIVSRYPITPNPVFDLGD